MAEPFPDFDEATALAGGGSWTALFESFDQRRDAAYYFVTVRGPLDRLDEFWAMVSSNGLPDRARLFISVQRIAESGESNTDYLGGTMWQIRRRAAQQPQ